MLLCSKTLLVLCIVIQFNLSNFEVGWIAKEPNRSDLVIPSGLRKTKLDNIRKGQGCQKLRFTSSDLPL